MQSKINGGIPIVTETPLSETLRWVCSLLLNELETTNHLNLVIEAEFVTIDVEYCDARIISVDSRCVSNWVLLFHKECFS